jgi:threonine synthase
MSLQYVSTRSATPLGGFQEVLLEGLAPDGGLAVPQAIPCWSSETIRSLSGLAYPTLAAKVVHAFADDFSLDTLTRLTRGAYTAEKFGSEAIAPVTPLGMESGTPLALLELSNGPTLAFKDMAMQMLGQLFEYVLTAQGKTLNILGATSGDTGSAAEYAMRDKKAVAVFMLSPQGRMSAFQRAQMYSLQEPNIHNLTVPGAFDDCQDMVKAVSADLTFKARLRIGTVNSINWARITAQVVYYFAGYFQAISAYGLRFGDPVDFSVPSGNFGNVLSGHVARSMGLPIGQLVVATNENNVLDEFFKTGRYRPRSTAETYLTSSPSMDISKASNFERYVYDLLGRDPERLAALWRGLADDGSFALPADEHRSAVAATGMVSGTSGHANRLETIRDVDHRYGRVIDPHTADGVFVGRQYLRPGVPMLCLETALPVKFEETIREALGRPAPRPDGLSALEALPQRVEAISQDVAALKALIEREALRPEVS